MAKATVKLLPFAVEATKGKYSGTKWSEIQ